MLSRRSFLRAVPVLVAAPAIVRAASLMKISALPVVDETGEWLRKIKESCNFSGDCLPYIDKKVLPVALRELVVYQFGEKKTLPDGSAWVAVRNQRLRLPFASLSR